MGHLISKNQGWRDKNYFNWLEKVHLPVWMEDKYTVYECHLMNWPLLIGGYTYISSMVKSGFHKTSVGSETFLIPQKSSGCHWMCSLFQLCRDTAEFAAAKARRLYGIFECSFQTHCHHPNVRNKGLVHLPLKTGKRENICS